MMFGFEPAVVGIAQFRKWPEFDHRMIPSS
jgi:hypothetical protein